MAHHVFGNEDRDEGFAVVDGEVVANKVRSDHGTTAPGLDGLLVTGLNSGVNSAAARRPSYTAAGRLSRASTLENSEENNQKSTSDRLSGEIDVFGSTVERFQSQVIHFSKRKIALSEQKNSLEENTSALLQELAKAESAQNRAIESEDYEEAETFNATIADVQNRQRRNASVLR